MGFNVIFIIKCFWFGVEKCRFGVYLVECYIIVMIYKSVYGVYVFWKIKCVYYVIFYVCVKEDVLFFIFVKFNFFFEN